MATTLSSGWSVSHYRIVSRLGAGGMGEVYQAHDASLERPVALKILPPELVRNEDRVRRFVQEAKSASALSHPHIVTIYEIGEAPPRGDGEEGRPIHFIAMELIDGRTLRNRIDDSETELRDLVRWLSQAAEGLAKAHAAGIIHRDLKPENIMITRDGYAKVLDFGLAKLTEPPGQGTNAPTAVREMTGQGVVMGTVSYMSPEQVQGKLLDHRSDIFSFGCILYEAATRTRPFQGDTHVDTMHEILHAQPAAVREINPEVPSELRRMVRRCLAKDPDRRYQSMKDLAIELSELVEDWGELSQKESSRSSGSVEPIRAAPVRKHIGWIAAIAGVTVLIAAALLWQRQRGWGESQPAVQASFTQLTDYAGAEFLPTLSPDGKFVAYTSSAAGNGDIHLLRIGGRNPLNLTEDSSADDWQPAFSPDGQWIAFRSEREGGGIFVMGATGESVRRVSDFGHHPAWSPDGRKLVVASEGPIVYWARSPDSQLWVIDVETGKRTKIYDGDAVQPHWSPHGHRIAFWALPRGSGQRDIGTIPAPGGEVTWATNDAAFDADPYWSRDGKWLYFSSDRGGSMNLWRLDIDERSGATRGMLQPITTPARSATQIAVADDGRTLVFASEDIRSTIERLAFDPVRKRVSDSPRPVTQGTTRTTMADVSPDGQWVAYQGTRNQEDIFIVRTDGSGVRQLTNDLHKDRLPSWSPDGKRIVFFSDRGGTYQLWLINADGSGLQQITQSLGTYWLPRFSPDGKRISVTGANGSAVYEVRPFPMAEPKKLPPLDRPGRVFAASSWSPDGKRLAGGASASLAQADAIVVYSFETAKYDVVFEIERTSFGRATWLPDGRHILFASGRKLFVGDVATGQKTEIYSDSRDELRGPTISPDGRAIFYERVVNDADLWLATVNVP